MKRVLQRFLALMMVLWTSSQLSAADFEVGGVYYNILSETNKTVEVTKPDKGRYSENVVVPSVVAYNGNDYTVNAIGKQAFFSGHITSVSLPSTLESIGEDAFRYCSQLESITIPEKVKRIDGSYTFGGCNALKEIIFLGLTPPEPCSLDGVNETVLVFVPTGSKGAYKERIGNSYNGEILEGTHQDYLTDFEKDGINYVVRPLNGDYIQVKEKPYPYYSGEIEIPSTVTYDGKIYTVNGISEDAFRLSKVTKIVIPESVKNISDGAISSDPIINGVYEGRFTKVVMLGNTPPDLALNSGFKGDNTVIYVPEGSLAAYKNAPIWGECNLVEGDGTRDYLTTFEVDGIVYAVIDCVNDGTEVRLANEKISNSIENITISTSVQYNGREFSVVGIGGSVFGSKLETIVIPESVVKIGASAFSRCRNLQSVTVLAEKPPVCESLKYTFASSIYPTCKLYVPEGTEEAYKSQEPWSEFGEMPTLKLSMSKYNIELGVGGTVDLEASVEPTGIVDENVIWTSSKPEIATVDENGKVVAESAGETIITATCAGLSAECTVTVTEKVVPAESIEIIASDELISAKTLKKGETLQLTAKTTPVDATDKITWSSDNGDVATVDENGLVTAKGVGNAVIKVTAGEKSATCEITVISPAESVTLDVEEVETINKGEKLNMTATIMPEDCTDEVEWSVEGDAVTIVVSEDKKSCEVTAVKAGEATVTVKAGEKSASCKITVEVPMTGIELDRTEAEGYIGGTIELNAIVKPEDTTDDKTVTWTSSDEEVATVGGNGLVSCLAEGTAVITATCGEFSAECTVAVTDRPPFVAITSLSLSETEVELPLNYTYSLFGIIAPENATNKELEWSTSNPEVARVYQGVVSGIVPGEAVITARTTDGSNLSASCKFTIVATSGIESTEGDEVKVTVSADVITVKGASVGAAVEVYSMNGACVAVKTVESSVEELPVVTSGIYVVRVNGKTFKVAL